MLGGGYQTPNYHHFNGFIEALLGAAGGAGVSIQEGALSQLGVGVNYEVNNSLGFYTEVSKTVALQGGFNPTTIDVGVSYSFDLLT